MPLPPSGGIKGELCHVPPLYHPLFIFIDNSCSHYLFVCLYVCLIMCVWQACGDQTTAMENPFSSSAVVSGSWTRVGFDGECSSPLGHLGSPAGATLLFEDIEVAGRLDTSLPPDKLETLSRRMWSGILMAPLSTC